MGPQAYIAIVLALVQLATTIVLFLVSKLLQDNKEAIGELRKWIREVSVENNQSLKELTSSMSCMREKLNDIEVSVARMDVFAEMLKDERRRARAG